MNKIYKSLWSQALGTWVAVPETARCRTGATTVGGVVGASSTIPIWRKHCLVIAMAAAWGGLVAVPAYAQSTPITTLNTAQTLYWNGSTTNADGTVHGGAGIWDSATSNWTSELGDSAQSWDGTTAVFQGASGIVNVEGTQTVQGLRFLNDGYYIKGSGNLNLENNSNGVVTVEVASGVTSSLAVNLSGTGTLSKEGSGMLALYGASTLGGKVEVKNGTLAVNGSISGRDVTVHSGAALTGEGTINSKVKLADGAHLVGSSGSTLTMSDLELTADS